MRIQHNIMAMNAYRNYSNNTSALSKNLEKLSSGYKINRAGDDAAGLAISEKMRAQITGLKTAQKNAKDGISLIQTAEGALTEVHDMLNRMVELADQSANGTYDDAVDRDNLQKEFNALRSEIDRISKATNFNGINLLDGSQERRAVKALGVQLEELNVNGTFPSGASKAEITMKLSSAPASETLSPASITNGGRNSAAKAGYIEIKGTLDTAKVLFTVGTASTAVKASTTLATLGNMVVSGSGSTAIKVKDLFDFVRVSASGATTAVAWDAAGSKVDGTTGIRLVAKTGGALANSVGDYNIKLGTAGGSVSIDVGANQGASSNSSGGTSYDITFDLSKLQGGQSFEIGSKTYKIISSGTTSKWGTASIAASTVNIYIAPATGTNAKQFALDALADGLAKGLGGNFTVVAGSITGDEVSIGAVAKASQGTATDLGALRWTDATGVGFIKDFTYESFEAQAAAAAPGHSTVSYNVDFASLKAGDKITIGSTSLTVVDTLSSKASVAKNQILKSDLASGAKIAAKFETAGYPSGKISIVASGTTTKLTITAAGSAGAVSGSALANGKGKVVIQRAADPVTGSGGLNIVAGKTTYKDIMDTAVGSGSTATTIGNLFDIQVKSGTSWSAAGTNTVVGSGAEIRFVAKSGGELSNEVMNMFNVSGATVDATNGNDETQGSGNAKTKYDLNFNFSKLAGGQTIRIGDAAHGKTFEISLDGVRRATGSDATLIDLSGCASDAAKLETIRNAINGVMGSAAGSAGKFEVRVNGSTGISLVAKDPGTANNLGGVSITEGSTATGAITGNYTAANDVDANGQAGTFAQVTYELNLDDLMVGDSLKIGGATINIVADDTTRLGGNDIRLKDAKDATKLTEAINNASHQASRVSIDAEKNTITITGNKAGQTAEQLASGAGKMELTSSERNLSDDLGGLTLQIGDTSDDFNQLNVSIKKMNCVSLGIDASKININKQEYASEAVKIIKNAINTVSGTRGDLGALQNRLEHTISNLAVMQENIQDAEATIRDVDVAEEMMAYTKNNILVQSAQAMLAQANQLPQGVLQLLQ